MAAEERVPFGYGTGRRMAMLAMPVAICACAQAGSWQNPNVPQDQWSADRAYCMDGARDRAEREFANRAANEQIVEL